MGVGLWLTGANAEEWIAVRRGTEGVLALGMIHAILAEGLATALPASQEATFRRLVERWTPVETAEQAGISPDKVRVLARALARSRPSLAVADGKTSNGTDICLAITLLNYVAGNVGRTVSFGPTSPPPRPPP